MIPPTLEEAKDSLRRALIERGGKLLETRHLPREKHIERVAAALRDGATAEQIVDLFYPHRRHGSAHYAAKLDENKVQHIRADKTTPTSKLADLFGVSPSTIRSIRSGTTWKHVT